MLLKTFAFRECGKTNWTLQTGKGTDWSELWLIVLHPSPNDGLSLRTRTSGSLKWSNRI